MIIFLVLYFFISNHSQHAVKSSLAEELKDIEHMQWKI